MRRFKEWVGGCIIAACFVAAFLAYFVTREDGVSHQMRDGLGRALSPSPLLMRLMFGQERLWAGWAWFGVDMLIFWGGLSIGAVMLNFSARAGQRNK